MNGEVMIDNSEIKVSIIIPIYNVEKYVTKCIQSACDQTYYNIEIILVDDESKDNSGKIADSFSRKDGRIKVIQGTQRILLFQSDFSTHQISPCILRSDCKQFA